MMQIPYTLKFRGDYISKKLTPQNNHSFNFRNAQRASFSDQSMIDFRGFIFANGLTCKIRIHCNRLVGRCKA